MEFYDLIKNRESIRDYDPAKPVDMEVLKRIVNAGRLAPSAANRQAWRLIVVSSPEMREKINHCYDKEWFHDAPHVLIVVGNKDVTWTRKYDGYNAVETDMAITMDHMVMAAENEGVATCWIAAFEPQVLREALMLDKNEVVFSITPLGYPREGFTKRNKKVRKSFDEVAEFI